ncbi:MAG: NAD(P)-dependent glycerol-3-phosphate dehydrogenase [Rhodospirillales bacterium]|nr:NAD(P)-dependent glycerol-3-phosphate dehydrogenase [Alphaproteobacteria bacterium]MCB9986504.1 NAD(P)-dependent glycerol-3-phosphate dehydrogenase [Rhodospirillales bacterium]USO06953.1 MAG: NAD(P)-dependent glycerol-3-phosphate dehydrogenase [Rhodospirillales bacterium]
MSECVNIIGGGAWGTALAQVQARAGRGVTLWAREHAVVAAVNNVGENTPFLPGVELHRNIHATEDLGAAIDADILLLVVPTQYLRAILREAGADRLAGKTLVLCAKGIEIETGELLSRVVREVVPGAEIAVMSGPTFAREIAMDLPAAVTLAAPTIERARDLAALLGSRTFRPYASDDVAGAEIGGAVKNVLAIACGVVAGRKYGDSARAALLTRGMSEMMRLGALMGGRRETLMGMCGLGDLVLTATSMQSRNFSLGFALGEGRKLADIMAERSAVTEGVHTAVAIRRLTHARGISLPVLDAIHDLLHGDADVETVIDGLLSRPFGDEA